MLAGDVQISVSQNTLQISGDAEANHVIIEGGNGGSLTITGANNTELFFGGVSQGSQIVIAGGFNSLAVDLNAGNDTLEIDTFFVFVNVSIAMDEGADVVRMGDYQTYVSNPGGVISKPFEMTMTGNLQVDTGTGADLALIVSVSAGNWDIDLGDSDGTNNNNDGRPENNFFVTLDDQAYIYHARSSDVNGDSIVDVVNVDINGGTGDDLVNINYLTTTGTLGVSGVAGNDVLSANGCVFHRQVMVAGGAGADTIALDFSRHDGQGPAATINLDSGSDSDFILFARCLMQGAAVAIATGSGFDRVVIGRYYANAAGNLATGGNVVGTVSLNTDSEADTADVRGNVVQSFFASFGGGGDNVDFLNNDVRPGGGSLDGGLDSDNLTLLGNLGAITPIGFEAQDSVFEADLA
jgi:hypothetical protein